MAGKQGRQGRQARQARQASRQATRDFWDALYMGRIVGSRWVGYIRGRTWRGAAWRSEQGDEGASASASAKAEGGHEGGTLFM